MTEREREKVIKGLMCIAGDVVFCAHCKYSDVNGSGRGDRCKRDCAKDAIALLKAQEPRLVTELDFNGADKDGYIPAWTEEKDGDMYCECIPKAAITDPDGIGVLRYWTSRPTDAQREKVKWDAQEQRDYEAAVEMAEYCERYEPTYNADDGSM